jgi:hypothetical protein
MALLTPEQTTALLARLNGLIAEAQALQIDLNQKAAERLAQDRWILPALSPCPTKKRRA